jgi:putative salt-induced outer membrane protein
MPCFSRFACTKKMFMKRVLALTLCVWLPLPAGAQDSGGNDRISGKAALGYLATSGNTESTSANAAFSIVLGLPVWRHAFVVNAIGASTNDQTTAEAYTFKYEARRAFGEHQYVFTAVDWKLDRFSGYAEQLSETVGYGRRLVNRERHRLDGGLGFGARQSELRDGQQEDDAIVRGSIDYVWSLTDTTEFEQALVAESGSTNTMVESRTALRARIIGNIALVLSYRVKYNTSIPQGAANADRFSAVSLEYVF